MRNRLENIMKFFDGYNSAADSAFKDFSENFSRLKAGYLQLRDDHRRTDKIHAEDFNLFQILGVAHYEVSTHSAVLRELLDSTGTHGQGNLFFLEFLSMLAEKGIIPKNEVVSYSTKTFDDYICEAERSVDTGRIDIIIERVHGDFPFCLIIENKVWAIDQEKQIERYWQELDSKKSMPIGRKKILYLSLAGHLPSEWSIDNSVRQELEGRGVLHCISYKQDIKQWLENALAKVGSEKVKYSLIQYMDVFKTL